jgi:hypothetical protein
MLLSKEYIAGFFDGEGHVSITYTKRPSGMDAKLCVKLTNTHLPVLETIQSMYGGSITATKKSAEHYLQCYVLGFSVEQSKTFLTDLLPFLVIKHSQAKLALKFSTTVYRRGRAPVSVEEHNLRQECMTLLAADKRKEWCSVAE